MTMTTRRSRTASLPANQVAHGEPEPIVAALQLPLTVVEFAPSVANTASLPLENSNHNINGMMPSRPFHPPTFIPPPPPYTAQDIPSPPVRPFGGYSGFYRPAPPRPFSYKSRMEYSQTPSAFSTTAGTPSRPGLAILRSSVT